LTKSNTSRATRPVSAWSVRSTRSAKRRYFSRIRSLLAVAGFILSIPIFSGVSLAEGATPAPSDAKAQILSPSDGATVTSPVVIQFGLSGMGVAPAGIDLGNTGHHHLIIDAELPNLQSPIPSDANYRHFGAGQTQVSLELEPGTHTLQLLLGDYRHIPHDSPVSSKQITITVVATR
jgi:hypothetical protein